MKLSVTFGRNRADLIAARAVLHHSLEAIEELLAHSEEDLSVKAGQNCAEELVGETRSKKALGSAEEMAVSIINSLGENALKYLEASSKLSINDGFYTIERVAREMNATVDEAKAYNRNLARGLRHTEISIDELVSREWRGDHYVYRMRSELAECILSLLSQ